jgi:iron complex outermembrane receptor protein
MDASKGIGTALIALLAATGAAAQEGGEAAGAAGGGGIADIVVTATRRPEKLQNIPVSVTALSGGAIGTPGIRQLRDITQIAPAYTGSHNQMVMQPTIRGVGSSGTSLGDEANVATYIDGVYQADPWSTQNDLVEVERVEVLRGPQGTVFGRNATGGLVNIITPDPSFETRGRVAGSYARMREGANDFDIRTYVTGGVSDRVAMDFSGLFRQNDGFITDLTNGGTIGAARAVAMRSKLMFQPSDAARIIVTASYVDSQDQTSTQQPYHGNTMGASIPGVLMPGDAWQVSYDVPPENNFHRLELSLRTSFDLGVASLETTTGFSQTRVYQRADSDASNIPVGFTDLEEKPDTYSQEIRLLSPSGNRLNWLVGAYAFHLNGEQPMTIGSAPKPGAPLTRTVLDPRIKTTSWSGFAEGTYELVDSLFLTLGGRYTTEERKFKQNVNGKQLFDWQKKTFDKFTWRAALRYNFAERSNVYVTYGTGFKSGVFNAFGTSRTPVNPETIKALEGGIKADPVRWLRTNLSVYRYWYDNLQVTARDANNSFVLQNAATAKIYGGEFEVTATPLPDLNIRASAVYNHSTYTKFPGAQAFIPLPGGGNLVTAEDASGNRLIRAPRYTFSIGGDYSAAVGNGRLNFNTNLFVSDKVYYDFANTLEAGAYTMLAAEIGWTPENSPLTVGIFGSNLTNAKVPSQIQGGPTATQVMYERPRVIGARAEYRF